MDIFRNHTFDIIGLRGKWRQLRITSIFVKKCIACAHACVNLSVACQQWRTSCQPSCAVCVLYISQLSPYTYILFPPCQYC